MENYGKYTYGSNSPKDHNFLRTEDVKLSIDDLVKLEMMKKLQYDEKSYTPTMHNGDYYVDINNPIVRTVVDKIKDIRYKVKDKYDIRVLEDRIDSIVSAGKEIGAFFYMLTPFGWAHMYFINRGKDVGHQNIPEPINTGRLLV